MTDPAFDAAGGFRARGGDGALAAGQRLAKRPRILVVDDHPLACEALEGLVRSAVSGASVDRAGSIKTALEALRHHSGYDLVLLDLVMPDSSGLSGLLAIRTAARRTPVLVISSHGHPETVAMAKSLGAAGFAKKTQKTTDLAMTIQTALSGTVDFPDLPRLDDSMAQAATRVRRLSRAQHMVMARLSCGDANKQIAHDLGLSEATVKSHVTAILRKLGVTNRSHAILMVRSVMLAGLWNGLTEQ